MIGIDLFSGAGGMSLGAVQAGIEVVCAIEEDKYAAQTYSENHPGVKTLCQDIATISDSQFRKIKKHKSDLIVFGGPPCQGFSWSNPRTRTEKNRLNTLSDCVNVLRDVITIS
jgi:DNA (cytosine-5)-methyltransferase 1